MRVGPCFLCRQHKHKRIYGISQQPPARRSTPGSGSWGPCPHAYCRARLRCSRARTCGRCCCKACLLATFALQTHPFWEMWCPYQLLHIRGAHWAWTCCSYAESWDVFEQPIGLQVLYLACSAHVLAPNNFFWPPPSPSTSPSSYPYVRYVYCVD